MQNDGPHDQLETTARTAKIFRVSKWWLYEHAHEIPAAHLAGHLLRWDIAILKKWMRKKAQQKASNGN